MRMRVVVDTKLVAKAMELSGTRSAREAAELALRELVKRRQSRRALLDGHEGLIAADYDVRVVRRRMQRSPREYR